MPAKATVAVSKWQRPTRRATLPESRERLLDAAERLILSGGAAAVTTVSVTRAAGFAQSGFYLHFDNTEACLRAVGERIAVRVRDAVAGERRRVQAGHPGDLDAETALFAGFLRLYTDDPVVSGLLLRNQHDPGPLGQAMAALIAHLRADLTDDLWKIAASLGVAAEHRPRVGIISDFILANVFAAGEALLNGRIPDAALLASQLAMTTQAACTEFILRYGDPAKYG